MLNKVTISQRLKEILEEKNITQKELCSTLDIAPSTFNNWIKLNRSIPSEYLLSICEFLNITIDWLLTGEKKDAEITQLPNQIELIENYEKLNERGKEEALKRVHELTYISQYTDTAAQEKIGPAAIAAYGGKGVEMKPLTKEQLEKTQEALKKIKFRTE